jgi:hypothetical protein
VIDIDGCEWRMGMELNFQRSSLEIYLVLGSLEEGAMVVQQEPLTQPRDYAFDKWFYFVYSQILSCQLLHQYRRPTIELSKWIRNILANDPARRSSYVGLGHSKLCAPSRSTILRAIVCLTKDLFSDRSSCIPKSLTIIFHTDPFWSLDTVALLWECVSLPPFTIGNLG